MQKADKIGAGFDQTPPGGQEINQYPVAIVDKPTESYWMQVQGRPGQSSSSHYYRFKPEEGVVSHPDSINYIEVREFYL